MHISEIPTPALVIDLDRLNANLERMAYRASQLGVKLRPHIKTHKCVEIARKQIDFGARGITVATLHEARSFRGGGFSDITWAFPVIMNRIAEVREIAQSVTFRVVVDSAEAVRALREAGFPLHVMLKVDCGYHRAGVDPETPRAVSIAHDIVNSSNLVFDGILSHSGHAYNAKSRKEMLDAAREERDLMLGFKDRLESEGITVNEISVGSTPSMSVIDSLDGATEARPGNYVFYDYSQVVLGTCEVSDCSLTVISSVVSRSLKSGHSVIDAGALALSKDGGLPQFPHATMGEIFSDYGVGRLDDTLRVTHLSQEHGIISRVEGIGERLRILPNHSCLTAANFSHYEVVQGEEVVDRWKIHIGR